MDTGRAGHGEDHAGVRIGRVDGLGLPVERLLHDGFTGAHVGLLVAQPAVAA